MSDETYRKEELARDLGLMVKAGLLDIYMREDGEWVYKVSDKSLLMTEEEKERIICNLEDYADEE
jgi:DNA-binding transcriptional regulator PaaX